MSIQKIVDLKTLRYLVKLTGLECVVTATPDGFELTMDTGEVEPATSVYQGVRIINAYIAGRS